MVSVSHVDLLLTGITKDYMKGRRGFFVFNDKSSFGSMNT